jgi:hypothetical protein
LVRIVGDLAYGGWFGDDEGLGVAGGASSCGHGMAKRLLDREHGGRSCLPAAPWTWMVALGANAVATEVAHERAMQSGVGR